MSKKQWGHGYHEGKKEQIFEDFCFASTKEELKALSIHNYLSRIEEQIKLLQSSWMCQGPDHPLFLWCETILDLINAAHREHGIKYSQAE